MTKRSMHHLLPERATANDLALEGCLKDGMRKVASEPECPKEISR